ncbi:MAG: cytochrome c biogenesis protein CcsA [Prevotellaceae bacterium]|nr:cytochrome c biogenesis protein CcsA [Prevotellaceae bacterium]
MKWCYSATWFRVLWVAASLSAVWVIWKSKLWKRLELMLLHLSLLVILCGALTTVLTSRKGMIHLRQNRPECMFNIPEKGVESLPFILCLDSFRIEHYPGTDAPSDFVSYITFTDTKGNKIKNTEISMNNISTLDGYRLYQSSYDDDFRGSWLTVNYDPWGTGITYTGYVLLAVSMLMTLLSRKENFRRLLRHPALKRGSAFLVGLLACLQPCLAENAESETAGTDRPLAVIKAAQAEKFKSRQVIYNDRVAPLNTLALDFTRKLTGSSSFRRLSAEQVMISWMLYPEEWQHVKMIKIKNEELRTTLGLENEFACFADFFDGNGDYRLSKLYETHRGSHSKLEKAIREADEKVGILLMLTNGTLIKPLPEDNSVKPLSDNKIKAELLYNSIPFSKILFMFNLTAGLLLFFIMLYAMLNGRKAKAYIHGIYTGESVCLYASTLFHLAGYCLRWYISGTLPLTNGFETMQFVALCTLLISCALHRPFRFTLPFGFMLSGFILLVSYLGEINPQITPLMPVLVSPWLSSHVSMIMVSYSLFAFIMLNGVTALCLMMCCRKSKDPEAERNRHEQIETLTVLSRLMLYPATFMLAAGIFLGAVWANVSWGSYWSWDAKEVWALVTMLVYGFAFHRSAFPAFRNPKTFHIYMVVAFLCVIMTYFGVNYWLGGMHSYAG